MAQRPDVEAAVGCGEANARWKVIAQGRENSADAASARTGGPGLGKFPLSLLVRAPSVRPRHCRRDNDQKDRRMKRVMSRLLMLALLLAGVPAGIARAQARCFPETKQCTTGRFGEFWEQHGGLPVFGFAIAPVAPASRVTRNATYLTQWFQRFRFEAHPDNRPPYDVLLGRLGDERLRRLGRDWRAEPRESGARAGCRWFPATGHNVCNQAGARGFRTYWETHGIELDGEKGTSEAESLALFGLPLTEPGVETNAAGDRVLTQWFERARFEWHPDNPAPLQVLLGLLGDEVLGRGKPAAGCCSDLTVLSHALTPDATGAPRIVGEVRNDAGTNLRDVKVTVRLYDVGDRLLTGQSGYALIDIVKPGERSPFAIVLPNPPRSLARYTVHSEGSTTLEQPVAGLTVLASSDWQVGSGDGRLVFGEARNDSGGGLSSLQLVATFYDADGRVVAVEPGYFIRSFLAPAQTSPFEVSVRRWNGAVRYEIQTEARRP